MKYVVTLIAVMGLGLIGCGGSGGGIADQCDEAQKQVEECEGEDGVSAKAYKTTCDAIRTSEEAGATCEAEGDTLFPDIYECKDGVWTLKEGETFPEGTGFTCRA